MSRFVTPELVRLPLSQGDALTVKRRLNRGEEAEMYARMRAPGTLSPQVLNLERVLAYLVDWSFVDDAGVVVPYRDLELAGRAQTLNNLDPDDFREVLDAIDAHVAAGEAARELQKKAQAGASGSSATSPSPAGAAGATSGSTSSTPTSTTSSSPNSTDSIPALTSS